jgi:SAM-dependent methyltransferase
VSGAFYGPLASLYDDVVVDPAFPLWAAFLHRRWGHDPERVSQVLDVGCGTGLLAQELMALGDNVVGLDGSPAMLEQARRRLGPQVRLIEAVLPHVPDLGCFDAAVSTFDTLNYLTPEAFAATMPAVADRLRPGGWWIFDLHTDALLNLIAEQPQSAGEESGWTFTLDSTVDHAARTCRSRFSAVQKDTDATVDEEHVQFFFTDHHVRASLAAAGFDLEEVVDEYSEVPWSAATLRATWIARRR